AFLGAALGDRICGRCHDFIHDSESPSTMLRMVPLPRVAGEDKKEMPGSRPGITIPKYAQTDKIGPCGVVAAGLRQSGRGGGEIAELLEVRFLLLVARRQLEQPRR